MLQLFRAVAGWIKRQHRDVCGLLRALVKARAYVFSTRIDNIRIRRIRRNVSTLSTADWEPVLPANDSLISVALDGDGAVVLLRAIDKVGPAVIGNHVIELRGGLVVLGCPGLAAIGGNGGTAVIAIDHALRIIRVNP